MNDNAPEIKCSLCPSVVDFAYAMRVGEAERQPTPEIIKVEFLASMGWRQFGDGWLCSKHPIAEAIL